MIQQDLICKEQRLLWLSMKRITFNRVARSTTRGLPLPAAPMLTVRLILYKEKWTRAVLVLSVASHDLPLLNAKVELLFTPRLPPSSADNKSSVLKLQREDRLLPTWWTPSKANLTPTSSRLRILQQRLSQVEDLSLIRQRHTEPQITSTIRKQPTDQTVTC